jgi:hypothetical protein
LLVLLLPLLKKSWLGFNFNSKPLNLLLVANLVSFILFYFFDQGIYLFSKQAYNNITLLKFIAVGLFFFYLVNFNLSGKNFFSAVILHLKKHKFIYLVVIALVLRLVVIFYSPTPSIDVFWFTDQGAERFIQGNNPYSEVYFKVYQEPDYVNDVYSYWPSTILITSLFKAFFGDIRFTYVFAQLGAALIIYFLLKDKFKNSPLIPQLATLLFLYCPLSLFVIEQAWNESLSIFFLYLFSILISFNKAYIPFLIFGAFLAVKQLSLIFLVFLIRFKEINLKKYFLSLFTFVVILLPFFIWNSSDFINDTILHHIKFEVPIYSLTFNSLAKIYFFNDIPLIIYSGLLLVLLLFLLIRKKRSLSGIIHLALIFLLALFLIKQGFANYYYSISGGIILLIVLELRKVGSLAIES